MKKAVQKTTSLRLVLGLILVALITGLLSSWVVREGFGVWATLLTSVVVSAIGTGVLIWRDGARMVKP